jgi:hypothetical protein
MVGVPGDAALVEHEKQVGLDVLGEAGDLADERGKWHAVETAVGMAQELGTVDLEHSSCCGELRLPHVAELAGLEPVDDSPRVMVRTVTEAPPAWKAASPAPKPKLSSSGCAQTASTDREGGSVMSHSSPMPSSCPGGAVRTVSA